MKLLQMFENSLPSVINDPFKKTKVTRIYVNFGQSLFSTPENEKWLANGVVEFQNGETKGEQSFKGETFDEVVLKIKSCLENLK